MWRQAVLIQDISAFRATIDAQLQVMLEQFVHAIDTLTTDYMVEWIIKEEIWQNRQLPIENHDPRQHPQSEIYYRLQYLFRKPTLSELIAYYVRTPKLYDGQEIRVTVKGRDLFIHYYLNQQLQYRP